VSYRVLPRYNRLSDWISYLWRQLLPDVVGNHAPVVTDIVPSTYTIMQGETVTFTVNATDQDAGDVVTLEAVSLPANATFTSTPGRRAPVDSLPLRRRLPRMGLFRWDSKRPMTIRHRRQLNM